MASERQIAANRNNARASTGPRSRAGRQRIRNNAYRHGLAAVLNRELLAEIEMLTRQLAGTSACIRTSKELLSFRKSEG